MIKINGVDIATPKSFEVQISDIDGKTNRNTQGEMLRDRIATKRKLTCEWPPLTQVESSKLLNAVKDIFFTVTFPDPQQGTLSKTMYVGDRTTPAYSCINGVVNWSGLKMDFIEK